MPAPALKDVVSILGFDVADEKDFDLEKFKAHVNNKYLTKEAALEDEDIVNKITGKRMGSLTTKAAQVFGLKASDVKEKKLEEILELGATALTGQVEEWKKKAETGADKRVKDLELAVNEKSKAYDELNELFTGTKKEYETFKKTKDSEIKSIKLNTIIGGAKTKVPFIDGFDKDVIRKTGFDTLLSSKYKFDLDEHDNVIVKNIADDKRVKHPAKNDFATLEEILTIEAESNGLLKKNNAAGGKQQFVTKQETENNNGSGVGSGIGFKAHPRAKANETRTTE